mgnify:CR=1 FL=1
MDAHEKEKVKIKLIEEINSTSEKINKYKELSKPIAPENSIGRISRMDAINNKSVIEAALRESEFKLNQLQKIRSKIQSSRAIQVITLKNLTLYSNRQDKLNMSLIWKIRF